MNIFENLHTYFTIYFNILNEYLIIVIDLFQHFKINLDGTLCILDTFKLLKLYDSIVMYILIFVKNLHTLQLKQHLK